MDITNYGHFTQSLQGNIYSYTNGDGVDWYELRRTLTTWTQSGEFIDAIFGAWATVEPVTLRVMNVEYDPSKLVPNDRIVLGIDANWQDIHEGMLFQNGALVEPPPPPPLPYQIAKTTPWLRMTDDEAELITGAMQQANARQKAIYDAATYLSSGDPLWTTLHDMISLALGSEARATELLAPET